MTALPPAVRLRRWLVGTPVPAEPRVRSVTAVGAPAAAVSVAVAVPAAPEAPVAPLSEKDALRARIAELEQTKMALEGRLGSVMDKLSGSKGEVALTAAVVPPVAAPKADAAEVPVRKAQAAPRDLPPAMWLASFFGTRS